MKVFINGKRLKDVYPHATKWEMFKYNVRRFFERLIKLTIMCLAIYAIGTMLIGKNEIIVETVKTQDNLTPKIEELKNGVVEDVKRCESAGYSEDDGIIILDTNKKMSIGQFQYQKTTVIHYYKKFHNQVITPKDAVLIALDTQKAQELTKQVLFNEEKGWSNWYNCSKKYNLESRIKTIKDLEK